LGGNSILITQLAARIRREFKLSISMHVFFEFPIFSHLVQKIESTLEMDSSKNELSLITVQSKEKFIPLSYTQQRLWFLDQILPVKNAYNISLGWRIQGELNVDALVYALNEIIKRHDILRANMREINGELAQIINQESSFLLEKLSFLRLTKNQKEIAIEAHIHEEAVTVFNLNHDCLLRGRLLQLDVEENILLLSVHHIIADGWSIVTLEKELSHFYNQFLNKTSDFMPKLSIQYTDFAIWQRNWVNRNEINQQLNYWLTQLKDSLDILDMPTDRPRPRKASYSGGIYSRSLSSELLSKLNDLSQRQNVTLFMTLLTAFYVLLCRYSGQRDIVIGSPIANRRHVEIENLIGFFANTLALRIEGKLEERFVDLLASVKTMALAAYEHQDVPFEQIVDHLDITRDLSRNPVFQVMFAFQKLADKAIQLQGLNVKHLELNYHVSKFDLTLWVQEGYEGEEGLRLGFEYATDLFNTSTIERLGNHFINLLEEVVAYPEKEIGTYKIMSSKEEERLLSEWNGATVRYSEKNSVIELIEEQVKKTPELIALGYREEALSYSELNSRANKLAHYLTGLGITSGDMVGICLNRGIDLIVTLLATMKIGGVYVPLDPNYPEQRLNYIMQDCGGKWLLTESRYKEIFKTFSHDMVCIDEISMDSMTNSRDISCAKKASDLAYVIYTSGSTGLPKGVMIEHRNVLNFLRSMQELLEITEKDIFIGLTSISFDISGLEMYLPLITGSKLVLIDKEIASDGNRLGRVIDEEGVSVVQGTPSNWQLLLSTGWKPKLALKILCGGEALSSSLAEKLLSIRDEIINLYGPTETTIWSGLSKVRSSEHISIGLPIANTRFYVLDENLKLVPPGVVGELHISGAGVGRGYLNKAELTEQKFISNPYEVGERLYKTGDLVKRLEDGGIVYIGRIDNQVKVRGFRIEIGEIEAVLNKFSGIKEAVVILRDDISKEKELVAYLVVNSEWSAIADEALSKEVLLYLRSQLPDYMLPSHFVKLERLPLTPNGKVDRKGLPKPDRETRLNTNEYVAPVTEVEKKLSEIWSNILGIEQVGLHDNFFDLGGNSILVMKLIFRIHHELHQDVPMTSIFDYPKFSDFIQNISIKEGAILDTLIEKASI